MASKRLPRFAFAAWLGLFALAVQALIPALVAAEIVTAGSDSGSIFTLCAFGHVHSASSDHPKGQPTGDETPGTVCPICIALLASPPFTAPPLIALPLPASAPAEALVAASQPRAAFEVAVAYRSRAPPLS